MNPLPGAPVAGLSELAVGALSNYRDGREENVAVSRRDYYTVLGVHRDASPQSIRDAYLDLAKKYHPDVIGESGKETFQEISEAYETLSDPAKRREYNRRLDAERTRSHRPAWAAPGPAPMRSSEPLFSSRTRYEQPFYEALLARLLRRFTGLTPPRPVSPDLDVEVILTPGEAARGVEVPVTVPTLRVCPFCRGTGRDWVFPCSMCGQEGTVQERTVLKVPVPPLIGGEAVFEIPLRDVGGPDAFLRLRVLVA